MTPESLAALHCRPTKGPPMNEAEVARHLALCAGWAVIDGQLEKRFDFADFHRTMAFVNAVAWVAHREDHHPDMEVAYGHCTLRYRTHSAGGITLNDFICAAQVNRLEP
jgi:4a-hydroxytetrahydrobiopterin dehydratase